MPESKSARPSAAKLTGFALIPLLALLFLAEVGLRAAFFQVRSESPLALVGAYKHLRNLVLREKAQAIFQEMAPAPGWGEALNGPPGRELMAELMARYEESFLGLVQECDRVEAKFLVLYLPASWEPNNRGRARNRAFYTALAAKVGAPFLDLTEPLLAYPREQVTLSPENGHYSRFGNQLTAGLLCPWLKSFAGYRSPWRAENRPEVWGDLVPGTDEVTLNKPDLPYRFTVTARGLRGLHEAAGTKADFRVLILGDSVTFGPFVHDKHTYPYLLGRDCGGLEVLNAARAGYTITDQLSLFRDRARYAEADAVLLQVLDNDLTDLLTFKRNHFSRDKGFFEPSPAERRFFLSLKRKAG